MKFQFLENFAGVVYAHQLMVSIGDCIRDLELIAKLGNPEEFVNRIQYLRLLSLTLIFIKFIELVLPAASFCQHNSR